MTNHVKKQKKKRSPALAAAIILLFVIISVLIFTLAFFTSFDEITNVFNSGRIDIILTEPKWKPEKAKNIVPSAYLDKDPYITNNEDVPVYVFLKVTVPAVKYDYDKTYSNKGEIETGVTIDYLPVYKFVTLTGTSNAPEKNDNFDSNQIFYDKWALVPGTTESPNPKLVNAAGANAAKNAAYEYVFYYKGDETTANTPAVLNPHTQTDKPLFDQIYLQNFRNTQTTKLFVDRDYSIKVEAYGIQSGYLNESAAGVGTTRPAIIWSIINGS